MMDLGLDLFLLQILFASISMSLINLFLLSSKIFWGCSVYRIKFRMIHVYFCHKVFTQHSWGVTIYKDDHTLFTRCLFNENFLDNILMGFTLSRK